MMMVTGKNERMKYLVCFMGIENVINLAREQAERENPNFSGPTDADTLEIVASEVVALNEWGMWTLSPEDVANKAKEMCVKHLSADQVQDIRRRFRKGFEAAVENWEEILGEAIEEVTGRDDRQGKEESDTVT